MNKKTAVVLLNLGGPLKQEDIKPFLFNFFMDKNIISAPLPIRYLIAKLISIRRGKGAANSSYSHLGFKSPLLENTQAQAEALEKILKQKLNDVKVFVSMRYWHPMADKVAKDIAEYAPDQVLLLPLYPQFSTTTTKSSFENYFKYAGNTPVTTICCYPDNNGFIQASADLIRRKLADAPSNTRLLFSAHGLPEKIIKSGDPYQFQCELSAQKIVDALGIDNFDWEICYQSRVGPLTWIGPSTEEALQKAAKDGKGVVIYPHAFVSEHVETLVEIDIEYRELAHEIGISYFDKVETVGTHPLFIQGLADLVIDRLSGGVCPKPCPETCRQCPCRMKEEKTCKKC